MTSAETQILAVVQTAGERGTEEIDKRARQKHRGWDTGGRQRVMLWIHCMFRSTVAQSPLPVLSAP